MGPRRELVIFILLLHALLSVIAEAPCYMADGQLASSEFQICSSGLPSGVHSACCNLGKDPPDICLGGGLCQRQDTVDGNFLIYAVGCTDPTGKDPSCQQYCTDGTAEMYSLNPCPNARWCCNNQQIESCCNGNETLFTFDLLSVASATPSSSTTGTAQGGATSTTVTTTLYQNSATATAGITHTTSCTPDKNVVVAASVGAAVGSGLVAGALVLVFAMRWRSKKQQKVEAVDVPELQPMPGVPWRAEMETPPGRKGARLAAHEIDGKQVRTA